MKEQISHPWSSLKEFSLIVPCQTSETVITRILTMAQNVPENYVPLYATQDEWQDKELQQFAIDFYRISDNPEENQRWVDSFTEDASVQIGADKARGSKGISMLSSPPSFCWGHWADKDHRSGRIPKSDVEAHQRAQTHGSQSLPWAILRLKWVHDSGRSQRYHNRWTAQRGCLVGTCSRQEGWWAVEV